MVLTPEGRVQEARPIQSSLQAVAGGPPQTGQHFSEFGGYPQTSPFSQRPMLYFRECYGCGETGHIRRFCPIKSYRPLIVRGRGGHGRGRHSGGRGGQGNGGHQTNRGGGCRAPFSQKMGFVHDLTTLLGFLSLRSRHLTNLGELGHLSNLNLTKVNEPEIRVRVQITSRGRC